MGQKKPSRVKALTGKQRRFVNAYMGEAQGNGTLAAKIAGYAAPKEEAHRLTNAPTYKHVQDEIARRRKAETAKSIMTRAERQEMLSNIGRTTKESRDRIKAIDTLNKMDGLYVQRHEVSLTTNPVELEEAVVALYRSNAELWERIKRRVESA